MTTTLNITSRIGLARLRSLERVLDREGWTFDGFIDEPTRRVSLRLLGGAGGKHEGIEVCLIGSFDSSSLHVDRVIEVAPANLGNRNNHFHEVLPIYRKHRLNIRDGLTALSEAATSHEKLLS